LRLDRRRRPGCRSVDKNAGMRILQIERSFYRNAAIGRRARRPQKEVAFNMRALQGQNRPSTRGFIPQARGNPADNEASSRAEEIASDFGAAKIDHAGRFEIVTELYAPPDLRVDSV